MEDVTNKIGAKIEQWIEPRSVDLAQAVSDGLFSEVKPSLANSLPADIAPLPDFKSLQLISGRLSPEYLRLGGPINTTPFASSPMGEYHDYHMIAAVVERLHNPNAKQLVALLQRPSKDISERDNSHMRASLAREYNMGNVLERYSGYMVIICAQSTRHKEG